MALNTVCFKRTLVFIAAATLMAIQGAAAAGSFPSEVVKILKEPCVRMKSCTDKDCEGIFYYLGYKCPVAKCKVDEGKYYCCCGQHKSMKQLVN
jgi:hypothetical protein